MKSLFVSALAPLLPLLVPLLVGPLAHVIVQLLKQALGIFDAAPATAKRLVTIVVSFVLVVAVHYVGQYLPGVCTLSDNGIDCVRALTQGDAMQTIIAAIIAHLLHSDKKQQAIARAIG